MMALVGTFTSSFEVSLPLLASTTFHGTETTYRGRVTALWSMALVGTTPIGSPVIGALSDTAGPRYALALGAAACLAAAVIGRWPARGPQQTREPAQRCGCTPTT